MQNTRRQDLINVSCERLRKSYVLCAEHFENSQFSNRQSQNRLNWNAEPTIFAVPNPPPLRTLKRKPPTVRTHHPSSKRRLVNIETVVANEGTDVARVLYEDITSPSVTPNSVTSGSGNRSSTSSHLQVPYGGRQETGSHATSSQQKLRRSLNRLRVRLHRTNVKLLTASTAKRVLSKDELLTEIAKYVEGPAYSFIASQLKFSDVSARGRRWDDEAKLLALSLYYKSPQAYRLLARLFVLPCKASLCNWVRNFTVTCGFSDTVMTVMQEKVTGLSPENRCCVLLLDEMSLRRGLTYDRRFDNIIGFEDLGANSQSNALASSCLCFMVRGLRDNWKQPFAFMFSSSAIKADKVQSLLIDCLSRLHEIGLDVKAVISDQGSNFTAAYKNMGVTANEPFIKVNEKTVFIFYDPCHLIKSARNVLEKNSVHSGKNVATWEHLKCLYNVDAKRRYRLAPRLTSQHINLTSFSKMRVKLATQTLSHSVAAAVETNCSIGSLAPVAMGTAEYAEKFDTLFDCFNSSEVYCTKVYRGSLSRRSKHRTILLDIQSWLSTLKVITVSTRRDITAQVKCFHGWQSNINALLLLWNDLSSNHGFKFLLTRRLNQDPLENFFGVIRQAGGFNANPTPFQFQNAYRKACFNNLLQPSRTGNCFADGDRLLATLCKLNTVTSHKVILKSVSCSSGLEEADQPEPSDLSEQNALMYVCGYLLRKLFTWHNCDMCKAALLDTRNECDDERKVFLSFKAYKCNDARVFHSLYVPSVLFYSFICKCSSVMFRMFDLKKACNLSDIRVNVMDTIMKTVPLPSDCSDLDIAKLLTSFVNLMIFYSVKFFNRDVKQVKVRGKKNKKCAILCHK